MLNRSEYKERLSRRGQNGAKIHWDNYHANLPPRAYPPELPKNCLRITVDNLVMSKSHVLLFHPW